MGSRSPKRRDGKSSTTAKHSEEDTASTACQKCGWLIGDEADRVKIMPCAHLLCTLCALESHTKQRHACHRCPVDGCNHPTTSNKYIQVGDGIVKVFNTKVEDDSKPTLVWMLIGRALFVETISSSSTVMVTLCLDDVQWMDMASISVMKRVLAQRYNKCCRHDEMSDTHPFWGMIESVCSNGTLSVSVELKNVDANTLENVISDLLCPSPRLVKPLAGIVHSKTKGLPLFVSEMLRALNRDGLLLVDLDSRRWVWDQD
jgi:hypothetical protein